VIVSRARLDRELAAKDAVIAELRENVAYWRTRAERLIDGSLVRAGAAHQPTMEHQPPRDRVAGAASMLTAALAVTEIDSRNRKVG
jgi:hypothetical protein